MGKMLMYCVTCMVSFICFIFLLYLAPARWLLFSFFIYSDPPCLCLYPDGVKTYFLPENGTKPLPVRAWC